MRPSCGGDEHYTTCRSRRHAGGCRLAIASATSASRRLTRTARRNTHRAARRSRRQAGRSKRCSRQREQRAAGRSAALARPAGGMRVGIRARPAAFGFYIDDLEALDAAGRNWCSSTAARCAAAQGGRSSSAGLSEIFMRELEANAALRGEILAQSTRMPAYAGCGGLMYLARSLSWRGDTRRMVGAIAGSGDARAAVARSVRLARTNAHPWGGCGDERAEIPAHEFHYSSIEGWPGNALRLPRSRGFRHGRKIRRIWSHNFWHLLAFSQRRQPRLGSAFVGFVRGLADGAPRRRRWPRRTDAAMEFQHRVDERAGANGRARPVLGPFKIHIGGSRSAHFTIAREFAMRRFFKSLWVGQAPPHARGTVYLVVRPRDPDC